MKILCRQENLRNGVDIVEHAVAPGDSESLPGSAGILLEASDNQLILSASDQKVGIRCGLGAIVEAPGKLLVDGRYFAQVVRRLPETDVTLEMLPEENVVLLRAGNVRLKLQVLNVGEFPGVQLPAGAPDFVTSAHDLQDMIRHTLISVGPPEDRRPFISGILMEYEAGTLNLVSTDGNRLAVCTKEVVSAGEEEEEVAGDSFETGLFDSDLDMALPERLRAVVPGRTMNLVSRILGGLGEKSKVNCKIGQNTITFWNESMVITARLIEGDYPDYTRFTDNLHNYALTLSRVELLAASDRAGIMTKKGSAVMFLTAEGNRLLVSSREPELGHIDEELILPDTVENLTRPSVDDETTGFSGESRTVTRLFGAYQARFFIDALRVMHTEEVVLELAESNGPALLKSPDSNFFLYLVMPVKTSEGEI